MDVVFLAALLTAFVEGLAWAITKLRFSWRERSQRAFNNIVRGLEND